MSVSAKQNFNFTRRGLLGATGALAAGLALPLGAAEAAGGYHVNQLSAANGDRVKTLLDSLPYTVEQQGKGFALYCLLSQVCPYSKNFWADHKKAKLAVEYRLIAAPYGDPNQVLQAMESRTPKAFDAFMAQSLKPIKGGSTPEHVATYNRWDAQWKELRDIIRSNGFRTSVPMFVWVKDGVVETVSGYATDAFGGLVAYWNKSPA